MLVLYRKSLEENLRFCLRHIIYVYNLAFIRAALIFYFTYKEPAITTETLLLGNINLYLHIHKKPDSDV